MANYTVELRTVCENLAGLDDDATYREVIPVASPLLFDFDYEIFDDNYREVLQQKIIKHYYTREIGFDSVGKFLLKLDAKMNEIMPYYNEMYKSAALEFDPLMDTHITTSNKGTISTEGESSGTGGNSNEQEYETHSTGNDSNVLHDTPQGFIDAADLENGGYATNVRKQTGKSDGNGTAKNTGTSNYSNTGKNTTTNDYVIEVSGKSGRSSYGKLIKEFRDSLINIDKMIIEELQTLFFMLY